MRGFLIRTVLMVSLALAVLVPNLSGTAQAIPPPTTTKCAPALVIDGRKVATCGQTQGTQGRHGSYDAASGTYTWGPWRPRYYGEFVQLNTFVGFPALVDGSGTAYMAGTIYRRSQNPDYSHEGRRGTFRSGAFVPTSDWHEAVCPPRIGCPEPDYHYEPLPPPPPKR